MAYGDHEAYPVAMIPYINMLPYRALGTPPGCRWHDYVPRDSVEALANGSVMAAAVPVAALPGLGDLVEPLGQYGIAARESSMSVLFFSDRPFERISVMNRMCLTPDSATSVRLLHLLLGRHRPSWVDAGSLAGTLIIGDRALKTMHARRNNRGATQRPEESRHRYPHVTDLATRWYQLFGRPFVFARWMIRRDAPADARATLLEWLHHFKTREEDLVSRAIPIAARRLGLSETGMAAYFRCLRRVLDEDDLAGQTLFLREIRRTQIDAVGRPGLFSSDTASGDRIALSRNPTMADNGRMHDMDVGPMP